MREMNRGMANIIKTPFSSRGNGNSTDIYNIVEKLLDGKQINSEQREIFNDRSRPGNFENTLEFCSGNFGIGYSGDENFVKIPRILHEINKKSPKFFQNAGIEMEAYTYQHPVFHVKEENVNLEEKTKLIETKTAFNEAINKRLVNSDYFGQITKDMDIVGRARKVDEPLRNDYLDIGNNRLNAITKAKRDNNSRIDILMRVRSKDGHPSGVYTAERLLKAGANVFDYEEGQKFGVIKSYGYIDGWEDNFYNIMNIAEETAKKVKGSLSEHTGVTKKKLEKLKKGEKTPSFNEVRAIERFVRDKSDSEYRNLNGVLREKESIFTIYREFPEDPGNYEATEPQVHSLFSGLIIDNYGPGYSSLSNYIDRQVRMSRFNNREITLKNISERFLKDI